MRLRRTVLVAPGDDEQRMQAAAASRADVVMLDVEDAVAPGQKVAARAKVIGALRDLDWGKKTRLVRINNLESPYGYDDIVDLVEQAGDRLDLILLTKVKTGRNVWWVDVLLTQLERKWQRPRRIGLEAMIEELAALINAEEIARSSPRLEALVFGLGDYAASQGMPIEGGASEVATYLGDRWHYVRHKIVIAARAAGVDAVEGGYGRLDDLDGFRTECLRARALGFAGKWAITAGQIEIAHEVFSPPVAAIAHARKVLAAFTQAEAEGKGWVVVDGETVDAASIRVVREVLQKAELIDQ